MKKKYTDILIYGQVCTLALYKKNVTFIYKVSTHMWEFRQNLARTITSFVA